jgi:hypothetical protein
MLGRNGEPIQGIHIEPRWPVVLAIVAVLFLLSLVPDRVRAFPNWILPFVAIAMIVPMAALSLTTAQGRWLSIERIVTMLFFVIVGLGDAHNLTELLTKMVYHSGEITGLRLLNSSIAVWASMVLVFSLAYWRIDRGGPESRANHRNGKPDWLFPQREAQEAAEEPEPRFVDYLFLAFCTATAFSPTDTLPLTARAKLLMMLESMISLVTIVAVAARAINILGS